MSTGDINNLSRGVIAVQALHVALLLAGEGGGGVQGRGGGWGNLGRAAPTTLILLRRDGPRGGAWAGVTVNQLLLLLPLVDGDDHPVVLAGDQTVVSRLPLPCFVAPFAMRRRNIL